MARAFSVGRTRVGGPFTCSARDDLGVANESPGNGCLQGIVDSGTDRPGLIKPFVLRVKFRDGDVQDF